MECSYLKYALDLTGAAVENPRWLEGEREFFTTYPFFHMLMFFLRELKLHFNQDLLPSLKLKFYCCGKERKQTGHLEVLNFDKDGAAAFFGRSCSAPNWF